MKSEETILEEAKKEVHDSGNQSWHSISLCGIQISRKDMFDFLQEEANKIEYRRMPAEEFFEIIEKKIII